MTPQRQHRLTYSSKSTSYWACVSKVGSRLGFTLGAGGVLGPRLALGVLGDTADYRGGMGEKLVDTGRLVVRGGSAVRLLGGRGVVLRGALGGPGAFGLEGAGFELAVGHAVDDVGFVTYLQGADRGQTDVFEFGLAAVREERDGLLRVGDPAASRYAAATAARRAYSSRRAADASGAMTPRCLASQGSGLAATLLAEGPGPLVEPGGQLVGDGWGAVWCPLGPGHLVPASSGRASCCRRWWRTLEMDRAWSIGPI